MFKMKVILFYQALGRFPRFLFFMSLLSVGLGCTKAGLVGTKNSEPLTPVNDSLPHAVRELGIQSITPSEGSTEGGTPIKISGIGFDLGLTITLGDDKCRSLTFTSKIEVNCLVPRHGAGAVDVTVSLATGESYTASGLFTFVEPPPPKAGQGIVSGGGIMTGPGMQLKVTIGHPTIDTSAAQKSVGSTDGIGIQLRTGIQGAQFESLQEKK